MERERPEGSPEEPGEGPQVVLGQPRRRYYLFSGDEGYQLSRRPVCLTTGFEIFWPAGDQLDSTTHAAQGYNAYFSFSKTKTGYSGELPGDIRMHKGRLDRVIPCSLKAL